MYKSLKIHDFRLLSKQEIFLGKYITVLAGRNSTGKSTILGMLGNSSEIKKKIGVTYSDRQFRAEFSEIFKGSKQFDSSGSNRFELILTNEDGTSILEQCSFRTSWQKYDNEEEAERFRIIPSRVTTEGKKSEAKLQYPVLYLGLSRLFPIGESTGSSIKQHQIKFSTENHKKWFLEKYVHILSLQDVVKEVSNFSIGETDKKSGVGITTDNYDYLTNSSGQDNLGQILLGVLSFKRLKENMGSTWNGGLLLIDELEATLHPSAQARLLDILMQEARALGLQIVFTTHSLSLLKNICKKIEHNDLASNNVELYYITNANRHLEIKRGVDYFSIECDLLVQSLVQSGQKIRVYTEDAEARWWLLHLIQQYTAYLDILDVCVGCDSLMSLYAADAGYFGNSLIIFDGDVSQKTMDIVPQTVREHFCNIVKLPGGCRPEQVIYEYLLSLPPEHNFWNEAGAGFSWAYFSENGPTSEKYTQEKERDRYKKWLTDHRSLFDVYHLLDYWINDNPNLATQFVFEFTAAYNALAARTLVPKIL